MKPVHRTDNPLLEAYGGAALRRVHLATVILRPSSGIARAYARPVVLILEIILG